MVEATETLHGKRTPARPEAVQLEVGAALGPYELRERLAAGGMAEVWIAVRHGDFGFRQTFAVKTILPRYAKDVAFRTMFLEEARLASRVRHTNVLAVLDLGQDGDTVYQAMPLVEGASVSELHVRLAKVGREVPIAVAVRICIDVARGLHAAHELKDDVGRALGLVHRDVSPQNVLVGVDGVAKVSDFGIAKALNVVSNSETDAGHVKGKRAYLAPEQVRLEPVDRRADIFSLGVMLWELLTGRALFKSGDSAMFFQYVARAEDVRTHRPEVASAIAAVVATGLEPDPNARFLTAEAFGDALEEAARAAHLVLSAKDVGRLVEDFMGVELEARGKVLVALTQTTLDPASQPEGVPAIVKSTEVMPPPAMSSSPVFLAQRLPPRDDAPARRAKPLSAWPYATMGGLVLLAGVASVVAWRSDHAEPAALPGLVAAPETTASAAATTSPSTSASAAADSIPSAAAAPSASTTTAPTASAATAGAGRPAKPKPAAQPLPKFSKNPYGR